MLYFKLLVQIRFLDKLIGHVRLLKRSGQTSALVFSTGSDLFK